MALANISPANHTITESGRISGLDLDRGRRYMHVCGDALTLIPGSQLVPTTNSPVDSAIILLVIGILGAVLLIRRKPSLLFLPVHFRASV
jgi:hypothetical protein